MDPSGFRHDEDEQRFRETKNALRPLMQGLIDIMNRTWAVYDIATPYTSPPFPGTVRAFSDAGQGFGFAGQPFIPGWWAGGWNGTKQEVDENQLRAVVRALPQKSLWLNDIENWPYSTQWATEEVVERNVRKLRRVFEIVKQERPDIQIGMYGVPLGGAPQFSWNSHSNPETYEKWRAANRRLTYGVRDDGSVDENGGLVDAIDVVSPVLYFGSDPDQNDLFIRELTAVAKEIGKGKPIVPHVRFKYVASRNPVVEEYIPESVFQSAMELIRRLGASGVAVWEWTQGKPLNQNEQRLMSIALDVFGRAG